MVWTLRLLRGLAVFVLIAAQSFAATAASEADPKLASWDTLAPATEPFDDPFLDMTLEQKRDLRDVLRAEEAEITGNGSLSLKNAAQAARGRLEAAGLDADYLLEQRLVVMERRREEATGVTSTFLGSQILIDGFVLPLAWEGERVVEFLLVPWVGACIHTPPPPPNQIVHVSFPEGLALKQRFQAIRLEGTLRHEPAEHALFLIDGSRQIPVSYGLHGAEISGTPGEIIAKSAASSAGSFIARIQAWITDLISSAMTSMDQGKSAGTILSALLVAFLYGVLHTLGPGHGKAVVVSYFVGNGGSIRRGVLMGSRIAIIHVFSAVAVVFLLDLAVRQMTGAAPSDYRLIRLGSYALIILIGIAMLWQAVRALNQTRRGHPHDHDGVAHSRDHKDHPSAGCVACAAAQATPKWGGGWIAVAVGVVPCTGALIVMLFGLANDIVLAAILMVAAISAGMAIAMSAIGIAAIMGRNAFEGRVAATPARRVRFETGARVVGAGCVLVVGLTLFVTTLSQPATAVPGSQTATEVAHAERVAD